MLFFLGAQQEFEVTDKYKAKRTIRNWGKPCIWLNNKDPRDGQPDWKVDWLNANCVVHHLDHPLYSEEVPQTPTPAPQTPPPPTPRPRTPLFLPSPSPLTPLVSSPPPPPPPRHPAADTYRAYIDTAHQEISNSGYEGGQAQFIRHVEDHAELLHTRAAFRGEDTIQRDPTIWNREWDNYLTELNGLLDMEI